MKGIRATEVRNYVRAHGEQGMITCLEQLYEANAAMREEVRELAVMQLQIIKTLEQVVQAGGNMRDQIERMIGRDDDDDLPPAVG